MILEEMYSGRFYPCETVVPTSEVYRKAVKSLNVKKAKATSNTAFPLG